MVHDVSGSVGIAHETLWQFTLAKKDDHESPQIGHSEEDLSVVATHKTADRLPDL